MSAKPNIPVKTIGDIFTATEVNTIVDFFEEKQDNAGIMVQSVEDLSEYLISGEYVLPTGLVMINGTINIGANAIRLSTGTVLRGLSNATIISTNTEGVVRSTNISSTVILREFNVVCSTGPCFELTGTTEYQLNMFFVGCIGLKAGTITGFDVQSFKQCFISATNGFTIDGTTNKIFFSECPFFSITSSAINLASTLVADGVDIVTSFFKFNSPGIGIKADTGYQLREGKLRGSLISGTAVPLQGLAPSDLNWTMTDNSGISDSRIMGGFSLSTSDETVINAQNTPVKAAGITSGLSLNQRIIQEANNRLTYKGLQPAVVTFSGNFDVASGNNVTLAFYIAKNGTVINESVSRVRVSTGGDERSGSITAIVEMVEDDYVEIWVANLDGTQNLTCLTLNLNGVG